jgi:uncharacterized OB-fold protein
MLASRLLAWRCADCGRTSYPVRSRCPACWSESGAEVALPAEGEVHSHTTVHVDRPGMPAPYTLAYVDVGDVRLFARVTGQPRVGARARVRLASGPNDLPESTSIVVEVLEEAGVDG